MIIRIVIGRVMNEIQGHSKHTCVDSGHPIVDHNNVLLSSGYNVQVWCI